MKAKIISFFSVLIFGAVICFTGCKSAVLVDCGECVSVKFDGYSGSGQATATLNQNYIASLLGEMNEYTVASVVNSFSLETIENNGSLSNGDVITVKVKTDSSVLENAGVAALNTEQEITVSGLKEKEKVDIFKDVSIKVNGISPECTVSFSYSGDVCSPYSFSMKRVDGKETTEKYKNGDKIIISLTDSEIESLNKEYIIEETSREYTIQADKKYILSADDLSEKDVAALKKISDDYADNRFIKLNDWTQEEAAIVISKLTGLNSLILASEGNTHIKSVENLKYDSAYVGIGKTAGYFGQVKEERFAYFFYVGDLTYSYKNKETLLSDLALLVRLQDPVIDKNGKITYSKINFGIRESLDAALDEMLNGDFDKIS